MLGEPKGFQNIWETFPWSPCGQVVYWAFWVSWCSLNEPIFAYWPVTSTAHIVRNPEDMKPSI